MSVLDVHRDAQVHVQVIVQIIAVIIVMHQVETDAAEVVIQVVVENAQVDAMENVPVELVEIFVLIQVVHTV